MTARYRDAAPCAIAHATAALPVRIDRDRDRERGRGIDKRSNSPKQASLQSVTRARAAAGQGGQR